MSERFRPTPIVQLPLMTIALLTAAVATTVLALIGAATLVEAVFRYF